MEGIIGYQDGVELAPIKGKFTSLAAIMSILGDYFTEEAAKIEISKLGLFEIGGKIGAIRADGEAVYCIDDNSKFEFIIDKNEEKFIEITMFSEYDETNWFYYYLKNIRGKWKIVDQVSANTIKDENTYIAIRSSSFLYTDNLRPPGQKEKAMMG